MTRKKSIPWLLSTLFWGAFNDNLFKLLLIFCIADLKVRSGMISEGDAASQIGALAGAIFVIPFLLFSDAGGTLADHYSKSRLIKQIKFTEIIFMLTGLVGFFQESPLLLYVALFGMAAQSAFFGPCKFSIIPELVDLKGLSRINGLVAMFTFFGIITGTYAASIISRSGLAYSTAGFICIAVAFIGFGSALKMENLPAQGGKPKISPWFWHEIFKTCKSIRHDRYLVAAFVILCLFWSAGAFLQIQLIPYAIDVLGESKDVGAELFLFTSLGIAAGSVIAGKVSGKLVELGLVPVGAFVLAVSLVFLSVVSDITGARILCAVLGVGAGFMTLPLDAFIQYRADSDSLGKVLAANNFINFIGILCAALLVSFLGSDGLGLSVEKTMVIAGLALLIVAFGSLIVLPQYSARLSLILLTRLTHHVSLKSDNDLPEKSSFLLICDELSPFRRLALMSRIQEPVVFLIDNDEITWWNRTYFRLMKMIPVSSAIDEDSKAAICQQLQLLLRTGGIVALSRQQQALIGLSSAANELPCPAFNISFPKPAVSQNGLKKVLVIECCG